MGHWLVAYDAGVAATGAATGAAAGAGAGAATAAGVADGAVTRNPLMIPSVALAVATAWLAAVVTVSVTRYRSEPDYAITLRREVFSVMSFSR